MIDTNFTQREISGPVRRDMNKPLFNQETPPTINTPPPPDTQEKEQFISDKGKDLSKPEGEKAVNKSLQENIKGIIGGEQTTRGETIANTIGSTTTQTPGQKSVSPDEKKLAEKAKDITGEQLPSGTAKIEKGAVSAGQSPATKSMADTRKEITDKYPQLGALGDKLKVEDYDKPLMKEHVKDLSLFPKSTLERLNKAGIKEIDIANRSLPDLDSNQSVKGQHPRGWPEGKTWDSVGGGYNPDDKSVSAGKGEQGSTSLVLHETGHAIGDLLKVKEGDKEVKIDDSKALIDAHKRLFSKLPPYMKQDGAGGEAGRQEFFAESLAVLLKDGEAAATKRYDADYVKFLKEQVLK